MILYTEEGGVAATIWTDTIQMFVYLSGALVCLFAVARCCPDGIDVALASAAGRGKAARDRPVVGPRPALHAGGGDRGRRFPDPGHARHRPLPRAAAARGPQPSGRLGGSRALGLPRAGAVRAVPAPGHALWAHYAGRRFARGDEILPTFVSTELPAGWTGFILAAIVAAALSPSLNSMASTSVRDFYLPYFRPGAGEAQQMKVARAFTVLWGLAQMGVALLARNIDSALNEGLAALGYASGPTVGAFLLGVLTRSANSIGTLTGMAAGLAVSLSVGRLAPLVLHRPGVAWTWNVAVGAVVTVAVGLLASRVAGGRTRRLSTGAPASAGP
jgi:Na+/proline symporter